MCAEMIDWLSMTNMKSTYECGTLDISDPLFQETLNVMIDRLTTEQKEIVFLRLLNHICHRFYFVGSDRSNIQTFTSKLCQDLGKEDCKRIRDDVLKTPCWDQINIDDYLKTHP